MSSIYQLPTLKRFAETYLLTQKVHYNDLITGDHAADLLVLWGQQMTAWIRELEINRIEFERLARMPPAPQLVQLPEFFCEGRQLQPDVDYFLTGNKITFAPHIPGIKEKPE